MLLLVEDEDLVVVLLFEEPEVDLTVELLLLLLLEEFCDRTVELLLFLVDLCGVTVLLEVEELFCVFVTVLLLFRPELPEDLTELLFSFVRDELCDLTVVPLLFLDELEGEIVLLRLVDERRVVFPEDLVVELRFEVDVRV